VHDRSKSLAAATPVAAHVDASAQVSHSARQESALDWKEEALATITWIQRSNRSLPRLRQMSTWKDIVVTQRSSNSQTTMADLINDCGGFEGLLKELRDLITSNNDEQNIELELAVIETVSAKLREFPHTDLQSGYSTVPSSNTNREKKRHDWLSKAKGRGKDKGKR
jgi:hypothetical protein